MRKTAQWIVATLGALVVVLLLLVVFFQWSWLRHPIESRLSAMTGKQVRIVGPIDGTKGWIPHISFQDIRVEAPNFKQAPDVGTIDRVEIAIDLGQLLRGRLSFPLIAVDRPTFDLVRNDQGSANWDIASDSSGPTHRGAMPLLGTLKIDNGRIAYRDEASRTRFEAVISTLAANGGSGDQNFTLTGDGTYRQAPFSLRLTGGSLNALRNSTEPYDVDASASVGQTRVRLSGTVTDPFKLTDMNLKLTADGDNAEDLYPIFGIPAPSTPPYHLTGTVDRDGQAWLLKNFAGTVGRSDLAGTLRFEVRGRRTGVSGNLASRSLDFADLGLLVGAPGATAGDRPVSDTQRKLAQAYAASDRVLPDAPLNLAEIRNVDADVTFKAAHVNAKTLPLDDVDLHLILANSVLRLKPLRVGVAGGQIDSDIAIDARTDAVATDYDVRFHRFKIEEFFGKAGFAHGATGTIDGRIKLHGIGNSVRRSLATANGQASAIVDRGTISNLAVDVIGLDVAKTVGIVLSGDEQMPIRCMVADFKVADGTMTPQIFVLDTDASLITTSGSINLADERLDLSIKGDAKSASPLSLGGPITIGGTFKHPSAGLGAEAIARGGAAVALGALLAPLAAALGFIEPGADQDVDCSGLQRQATSDTARPVSKSHAVTSRPARRSR